MRGYFAGRLLGVEVGDDVLDDGSSFINVLLFPDGGTDAVRAWCRTGTPEGEILASLDTTAAPRVGMTLDLRPKLSKAGAATISARVVEVFEEVEAPAGVDAETGELTTR
jgi:hypothetical protein